MIRLSLRKFIDGKRWSKRHKEHVEINIERQKELVSRPRFQSTNVTCPWSPCRHRYVIVFKVAMYKELEPNLVHVDRCPKCRQPIVFDSRTQTITAAQIEGGLALTEK